MTTNSQLPSEMNVPSWDTAAHSEATMTKMPGMITIQDGRRRCARMIAMIDSDRAAMIWFVVPNSGHSVMPPEPSAPAEKVRTSAIPTAMIVEENARKRTPATSAISCTTMRCRRTPVSMVVAANSTAIVAKIVVEIPAGMPRPALTMLLPPSTKALMPPSLNAL